MCTARMTCAIACLMFGCDAAPAKPLEGGADSSAEGTTTVPFDGGECVARSCAEGETCWTRPCGKCTGGGYDCIPCGVFVDRCRDGSFPIPRHVDCFGEGRFTDPQC